MHIKSEHKEIQNVLDEFLQIKTFLNFSLRDALTVIELLPDNLKPYSITWKFFLNLFKNSNNEKIKKGICRLFFMFIKNNCYYGDFPEIIDTFKTRKSLTKELFWLFSNELEPFNLIVIEADEITDSYRLSGLYKNDSKTLFLSNLLKEFILNNNTGRINHDFYTSFQKSLNGKAINTFKDFNIDTFNEQYKFYQNTGKKNSNNSLTLLKKFYLKLLDNPDLNNYFNWRVGLDRNMLQSQSFKRNYEEGFRPIPLNSFDPVPEFDKWLVMPNGHEKTSTKINSFSYKPVDFSNIQCPKLKFGSKSWFWNSNITLSARIDHLYNLNKFSNFIFDLQNNHNIRKITGNSPYDLTVEEIFSYVEFVKSKKLNHISIVKNFLVYLEENNLYKVDPSAYRFLITKGKDSNNTAKDIPKDQLIKLEKKLKEKAAESYLNTLYYIIFHISIATEFRISQIINLKIDCLIKGVKKNFYLVSNTKVSNGKEIKIPITPYTKRYIETSIKYTQEVRNSCNNFEVKNHIFIHNNSSYQYRVLSVRTFSDYLKRCCLEIGIETYTAQNLRDTYMTKAIEYAMKNNLSDLETNVLTGHKRIDTTTNHYVVNKIKEYLEATHQVIVGNPVIKGEITDHTNHGKEDLVNDECGYCSNVSCIKKDDNLDCLMCNGFIATIDRIPYYEEKIKLLDNDIKNTKIRTEKDRLLTIKRLYLAYLAELLALKGKIIHE